MRKRFLLAVIALICVLCTAFAFGCSDNKTYYSVTFIDGQTEIETVQVEKGKKISEYPVAARSDSNYVFDAWFKDEGLKTVWNHDIERVTKNTTLYAGFLYVLATPGNAAMEEVAFSNTLTWLQRDITADTEFTVEIIGAGVVSGGKDEFTFESYRGHDDIYTVKWTPTQKPQGGTYSVKITCGGDDVTVDNLLFKGAGTAANPYLISSQTDLSAVNTQDISSGNYYKVSQSFAARAAASAVEGNTFDGVLDGNGKTVTLEASDCGLFGVLGENAEIKNLTVAGAVTNVQTDCVGAIASVNRGKILNCTVSASLDSTVGTVGTLSGDKDSIVGGAAGVAGINNGEISNCTYSGTVKANVGGAGIAVINNGTVSLCSFAGTIGAANSNETGSSTKAYSYIGGIAAINYSVIEKSSIDGSGKILAQRGDDGLNDNVGGIVAVNQAGATVRECWFDGIRVHGNRNVGGIAGANAGIITHCYSGGDYHGGNVKSHSYIGGLGEVGGIAGLMQDGGTVSNCFVTSNVYAYAGNAYKVASACSDCVYLSDNIDIRDGVSAVRASEDGNIKIELSGNYEGEAYLLVLTDEQLASLNGSSEAFVIDKNGVRLLCEGPVEGEVPKANVLSVALWTRYFDQETAEALFEAFKASSYSEDGFEVQFTALNSNNNANFKKDYEKGLYNVVLAYKAAAVDEWQKSSMEIYAFSVNDNAYTTMKVGLNSEEKIVVNFGEFLKSDIAKKIMDPAYVPDDEAETIEIILMDGEEKYGETLTVSNATGAEDITLPVMPAEEGYTFLGWAAEGSENYLSGKIGYEDVIDLAVDGKLTLYAVYEEGEKPQSLSVAIWTRYVELDTVTTLLTAFENSSYFVDGAVLTFGELTSDKNADFKADYENGGYNIAFGYKAAAVDSWQDEIVKIYIYNVSDKVMSTLSVGVNSTDEIALNFAEFLVSDEAKKIMNPAYVSDDEADRIIITLMNGGEQYGETLTVSNATEAEEVTLPDVTPADGYKFSGWATEDGACLSGKIGYSDVKGLTDNGTLTLYAKYEETDDKDVPTIIIGYWSYSEYVTETVALTIKEEFENYLRANGVEKFNVVMREYTKSKVADLVDAIQTDGDVDYFIGGGKNITSTAGSTSGNKLTTVGSAVQMTTRYIVQLTSNTLAEKFTAYSQTADSAIAKI